ncbi:MAG: energy transducer TonB [Deltaproteobacteria bacterium]|nr:energy transducer TonB [Deltaproteobacteria bacterium]
MQPTFTKALITSWIAHAATIAALVWVAWIAAPKNLVGDGVVEVVVVGSLENTTRVADTSRGGDWVGEPSAEFAAKADWGGLRPPEVVSSEGSVRHSEARGNPTLTAIWKKINRAKYYPLVAREQKLEGAPRVQFQIDNDGNVTTISLVDSSGSDILDDAALETIRRAAPLPAYPEPITLAIRYSLQN